MKKYLEIALVSAVSVAVLCRVDATKKLLLNIA